MWAGTAVEGKYRNPRLLNATTIGFPKMNLVTCDIVSHSKEISKKEKPSKACKLIRKLQQIHNFCQNHHLWVMFRCLRQHDFSDELPTSPRYASAQDCFDACGQSSRCQAVFIWQENNQEKPSCVYMSQACDVNADTCGPADWCLENGDGRGWCLTMGYLYGDRLIFKPLNVTRHRWSLPVSAWKSWNFNADT